ncbi:MAG: 50S ribosomal protein L19e [Candidatus Woesearchaeota archaeon]
MNLKAKRLLAAKLLRTSPKNIYFDPEKLQDIKEAITRIDIQNLIKNKIIQKKPVVGQSRGRTRKRNLQKAKGRRRGVGSRKGTATARKSRKESWMEKIRSQRSYLALLKEKKLSSSKTYRLLYLRCKGGYFRNKRHLKLYLQEHSLLQKK